MRSLPCAAVIFAACSSPRAVPSEPKLAPIAADRLHDVAEFSSIEDRAVRSRALFAEASRVLLHPRCVNCHPAGDSPHQGMEQMLHDPPVTRGPKDTGIAGLECTTCHQDRNQQLTRVPGAPKWQLAPLSMAWFGKSAAAVCAQIKDNAMNGGKTLQQVVDHVAHDELVAWGWHPGADRKPAPGTQQQAGALVAAWVDTGAECPDDASNTDNKETPR